MKLTLKDLSVKVGIAEGTIRAWMMKPIDGVPYSKENINYTNVVSKLNNNFPNFEKDFGFKAKDLEIIRAERTTKNWLTVGELNEGMEIVLHNYSLKTNLTVVGVSNDLTVVPNTELLIFKDKEGNYKAYSLEQLSKKNIKLELAE